MFSSPTDAHHGLRDGLGTTYAQADFATWRAEFGMTYTPSSDALAGSAAPEPTVGLLLLVAIPFLQLGSSRRILRLRANTIF